MTAPTESRHVVIRSWPKMVFCWPSAAAALAAGWLTAAYPGHAVPIAVAFLGIFNANFLVLSFDFGRIASAMAFLALLSVGCVLFVANQYYYLVEPIAAWFRNRHTQASPEFYFFLSAIQFLGIVGMFLSTRMDYWVLTSNELIHKRSMVGTSERYSTSGVKLQTEITDVFEYLLGGAGRLVMTIPGAPGPVILENVLGVRRVEREADKLLDTRVVRIEEQEPTSRSVSSRT